MCLWGSQLPPIIWEENKIFPRDFLAKFVLLYICTMLFSVCELSIVLGNGNAKRVWTCLIVKVFDTKDDKKSCQKKKASKERGISTNIWQNSKLKRTQWILYLQRNSLGTRGMCKDSWISGWPDAQQIVTE